MLPGIVYRSLNRQNRKEHLPKVPDAIHCEHVAAQACCNPDRVDMYAVELLWDGYTIDIELLLLFVSITEYLTPLLWVPGSSTWASNALLGGHRFSI